MVILEITVNLKPVKILAMVMDAAWIISYVNVISAMEIPIVMKE